MPEPRYVLTFDIDWAPDSSIQRCLEILSLAKAKAIFFATHHTDLNKEILLQGHDLGIHPNFLPNSSQGGSVQEIIETCLKYVPKAWCMRTHSLMQSSPLLHEIFSSFSQLKLDVSLFMHKALHVQKVKWKFDGVEFNRLMYNWEDDAEFEDKGFLERDQKFFGELTVFNFHPIHVHLNSSDGLEYSKLKANLNEKNLYDLTSSEVNLYQNNDVGIQTFLNSVLSSDAEYITLREV